MNAAAQRRLTPWLGALALGLVALWAVLLGGVGRGVRWDPPRPAPPLPPPRAVSLPAPAPLDAAAVVWQRPLFTPDRKPAATAAGVSLGDLELTGIILTPTLKMALLHDKTQSPTPAVPPPGLVTGGPPANAAATAPETGTVRVREGATLPDGSWRLVEVKPRSAVFAGAGGRTELSLPVTAPLALARPGEGPAPASTAGDGVSVVPAASPAPASPDRLPPHADASALERMRRERLREAVQARRGMMPTGAPASAPPPTDPTTPSPSLPTAPRAAGTTHPREP